MLRPSLLTAPWLLPLAMYGRYVLDVYTRLVLLSSIYHVFLIVAPLSTVFAWLYFLPAYPLYGRLLLRAVGRPSVDTFGALWEEAVRYQTIGLLVAQVRASRR